MLTWWLVVGVLVAAAILLTLLLAPLPSALHMAVVRLIDRIQKALWIVLAVMAWVLFGTCPQSDVRDLLAPKRTTAAPLDVV
jgi:hypothetical protein